MRWILLPLLLVAFAISAKAQSIARQWDQQILDAIRIDKPNPPVHGRNLFHLSVAMYDAWAAYDPLAVGYIYHNKHTASDIAAARNQAISYAAYRILVERYSLSVSNKVTLPALAAFMTTNLGYDPNNTNTDTSTPIGVGNSVAATVSAYFINDGALQANHYVDPTYSPTNHWLVVTNYGTLSETGTESVSDINRWQPLLVPSATSQNGIAVSGPQTFLGAPWLYVRPFALTREDPTLPWIDPGPPPHLNGMGDAEFRSNNVVVIQRSSELTPDDGVTNDYSPGAFGNNTLGTNDGQGHSINPVTGAPYAPNIIKRGDFARALAEFWADGPNSETPPGHWNVIANDVSDNTNLVKRIGGTGPVVDDLEWDVKLYFTLNAAVHDAACAAWSLKRYYDGWRPISAIRYMGEHGQSSDPSGPSYSTNGLPLVPGLIEVVTPETSQPGGRHAGLTNGAVAIYAWPGQPADPTNQYSGVHWIQAGNWFPYQKKTFVTPSFPGYISGHSTFSRAAAEVLAAFTGSPFFPGGIGQYPITKLNFEKGPSLHVSHACS
jgi:hypothetical protein